MNFKLIMVFSVLFFQLSATYDLAIIGNVDKRDGLSNLSIMLVNMLQKDFKLKHIPTYKVNLEDLQPDVRALFEQDIKEEANVSILVDPLWWTKELIPSDKVTEGFIKIAYSMIESSAIPHQWVEILNEKFDLVVVPDVYLKAVYEKCHVRIPIFVLPIAMDLKPYLDQPFKKRKNEIFTFGMSATFFRRKNYDIAIDAFIKEFKDNPKVKLKLHARGGDKKYIAYILEKLKTIGANNIELIIQAISPDEYVDFLKSLDCYIYFSKGEGFSLTPREAMACGIPCILTSNTAQKTICDSNFVLSVKSELHERAYYKPFHKFVGYNFNCHIEDACQAMHDMYTNYEHYLEKTLQAREWVKQYSLENLKKYYHALVKPKAVIFSKENKIIPEAIITNSERLYEKYRLICRT